MSEFHVWTLAQLRHLHGAYPLEDETVGSSVLSADRRLGE